MASFGDRSVYLFSGAIRALIANWPGPCAAGSGNPEMVQNRDESAGEYTSGRVHSNPGARLLLAARELFSTQGYGAAGINEIIARSGTSKKSFYNYFPGKQKLGEAYLAAERQELFEFLDEIIERHRGDFRAFIRTWAAMLKKAAGRGEFTGCPFARMSAQAGEEFAGDLAKTADEWREKLRLYLLESDLNFGPSQDGSPSGGAKSAGVLADAILVQYQGAVQMWRLSGNPDYFDTMAEGICRMAGVSDVKQGRRKR